MQEVIVFIRAESILMDEEIIIHFNQLELKFKDFLANLELEDEFMLNLPLTYYCKLLFMVNTLLLKKKLRLKIN